MRHPPGVVQMDTQRGPRFVDILNDAAPQLTRPLRARDSLVVRFERFDFRTILLLLSRRFFLRCSSGSAASELAQNEHPPCITALLHRWPRPSQAASPLSLAFWFSSQCATAFHLLRLQLPQLPPTGLRTHLRIGELTRVPIAAAIRRMLRHMVLLALATTSDDVPLGRIAVTARKRRTLRPGILTGLDAPRNVLDVSRASLVSTCLCHFRFPFKS